MCSDHRNLQSACHYISSERDTKPTAEEREAQATACSSLCFVSLRVCVVSFICVCIWRFFFFICLFVRTVSFGGWWLPAFPLCEVAAKKPGVCSTLLQPLWLAARPEVAAGASASLAQKVRSSGHREGQQHGST